MNFMILPCQKTPEKNMVIFSVVFSGSVVHYLTNRLSPTPPKKERHGSSSKQKFLGAIMRC